MPAEFSVEARHTSLQSISRTPFDLVIVGGGITGAGVLRDAAQRGLRTILLEKDDFAQGTSSRSSKLIHGGLRYLETFDFRLVFEASAERRILLRTAPELVRPLPFLFPVYRGDPNPLWKIGAGVWLYDLLSLFRNIGHPRTYGVRRATLLEPLLRSEGLVGAATYFDGATDDAQLTLATLRTACGHGGEAVNHCEVTDLILEDGHVSGLRMLDRIGGEEGEVRAKWVVNTTGPWSDLFRSKLGEFDIRLRPTKGVHLVLPSQRLPLSQAVVMISPIDRRILFALPWRGETLIGTTDTDYAGSLDDVHAETADVAYLLESVRHFFPLAAIAEKDVISTFAGLRPLVQDGQKTLPSKVSREHTIFSDRPGLVSITGGKLTTYRKMAEELVDWIIHRTPGWRGRLRPCATSRSSIETGSPPSPIEERVNYAIDHEMACTIADVLGRRTLDLYLRPDHGRSFVQPVAEILTRRLRLEPSEKERQISEYAELMRGARAGLSESSSL